MDKHSIEKIHRDLNAALKEFGAAHGITVSTGTLRYDDAGASVSVKMAFPDASGKVVDPTAVDFKRYCFRYGLTPEHLGTTFKLHGKSYTLLGAKPRSRKYPLICKTGDRRVKVPADDYVIDAIKAAA